MSVGFRDWQARRMMQELLQVKQKQAKYMRSLLESAIYQGLVCFSKLERLNHEDTTRAMERAQHMRGHHDREVTRFDGHSHYPTSRESQNETMYARVSSSNNVNNNANTSPTDDVKLSDHQVIAPKSPVSRIRSLPPSREDDTIMITNPTRLSPSINAIDQLTNCLSAQKQTMAESKDDPTVYSRKKHAPLPPVPDEYDSNGVYSLAQSVPPKAPRPLSSVQYSSRQNAPLPPPPTVVLPTHTNSESVTNDNSALRSDRAIERSKQSEPMYHDESHEIYDDATSNATPSDDGRDNVSNPQYRPVSRATSSWSPPGNRKRSPVPTPPSVEPSETNGQMALTKRGYPTAANVNKNGTTLVDKSTKANCESGKLSTSQIQRSRSPSPSVISSGSQGTSTPTPLPHQTKERSSSDSKLLERGSTSHSTSYQTPQSSSRNSAHRMSFGSENLDVEEAPPPPPHRSSATPTKSPKQKELTESVSYMPPVPPRKTSGGKPITEPEPPPLPSRKVIENYECSTAASHRPAQNVLDSREPVPPPLPSRKIIQEQSVLQSKKLVRRNATRTKSSESLTSLPEHEESTHLFSSMKGLLGPPVSRNRASSNEFSTPAAKKKLGKRMSDPSSQVAYGKNHIPIHKMPLPPIPVQMHSSVSTPQLMIDEPQDVYEDLDKARETVDQDIPHPDYEDIDTELDRPQGDYEDIDRDSDEPRDHYEDIDRDSDVPQDHYEDIDYDDNEDRPQEVYEDINSEAAQRVTFGIGKTGPQGYTPPISRKGKATKVPTEPEDYTPPITRRSVLYAEEDEPQDYTPPIRRGQRGYQDELDHEPQDYTPPIRRSRVIAEEEEPQDYSAPLRRSRVWSDEGEPDEYTPPISRRNVAMETTVEPSTPSPPLPPRSSSRQQHNHRRPPVTSAPTHSPVPTTTREQPSCSADERIQPPKSAPGPASVLKGRPSAPKSPVPSRASRPQAAHQASPQSSDAGAPPTKRVPPPPPPPYNAPPPVNPATQPAQIRTDSASSPSEPAATNSLLDGITNIQLKKASERKLPQKALTTGSTSSTSNLFAEMQSLQLRKTKKPNEEVIPSPANDHGTSTAPPAAKPSHAALKQTKSDGSPPTRSRPIAAPRVKSPAPRPRPSKPPPPSIKPKPSSLVSPKNSSCSPPSPSHSKGHDRSRVQ